MSDFFSSSRPSLLPVPPTRKSAKPQKLKEGEELTTPNSAALSNFSPLRVGTSKCVVDARIQSEYRAPRASPSRAAACLAAVGSPEAQSLTCFVAPSPPPQPPPPRKSRRGSTCGRGANASEQRALAAAAGLAERAAERAEGGGGTGSGLPAATEAASQLAVTRLDLGTSTLVHFGFEREGGGGRGDREREREEEREEK